MYNPNFMENGSFSGKKRGRVEFFDAELPEQFAGPPAKKEGKTELEIVRERMERGDEKIDEMGKEVDEVEFSGQGQAGFDRATEMIGQVKKLKSRLEVSVNEYKDPIWEQYKTLRNILTTRTSKLDDQIVTLKAKQNVVAGELEMARREEKRKADEAAAKLQAKIDAEQKKLDEAEKKAAKKEKREPVYQPPVVVDKPEIPKTIKTKTESGSATIKMILVPTITDLSSEFLQDMMLNYFREKYEELALKACNAAIKAGALGLAGAKGIKVEEKADTTHRRR